MAFLRFSTFSLCLFLLLTGFSASAQKVANRYPYVQSPTENSAIIAWRTKKPGNSLFVYGQKEGKLSDTIRVNEIRQKHFVELTGLEPNTRYFYKAITPGVFESKTEHFYTAKQPEKTSIRFLHYGDCGYDNRIQNKIADLMEQEEVDFAIVAGDVDQGNGDAYDKVFFGVYKNMLAHDCHFTAIGNHDLYKNDGETYLDDFYLPANNPQQSERYYTFTWGNAKFICMDSNIDYAPGSDQYAWLETELQDREREWLMVFFHHPPWTNSWDPSYHLPLQKYFHYQGNEDMRETLVPLFEKYEVDFVLNGHAHSYQRGEMNGVNYVISGGAGVKMLDKHQHENSPNIQFERYENHFVRFEINENTAVYEAVNIEGQVIDRVEVTKERFYVKEKPEDHSVKSESPKSAGSAESHGMD